MEQVKDFNINTIPLSKIIAVATSDVDYEMDRTLLVEDHPAWERWTVVSGGHCSCYGFDEVKWEARIYSREELTLLAKGWLEHGYSSELIIAPLILRYLGNRS